MKKIFLVCLLFSFLFSRNNEYYRENFNISFDKPVIYKDIKISVYDTKLYLNEDYYDIVISGVGLNACYVCINKKYGKYTILIGFMTPGDSTTDLYLSAYKVDKIDRFLKFFNIHDPTELNYYYRDDIRLDLWNR